MTRLVSIIVNLICLTLFVALGCKPKTNEGLKTILPDSKPLTAKKPTLTAADPGGTDSVLTCAIEYDQKYLKPVFYFYNSKYPNVARANVEGKTGAKSGTYKLKTMSAVANEAIMADVQGDTITCRVRLFDSNSRDVLSDSSDAYTVKDTAPVLIVSPTPEAATQTDLAFGTAMSPVTLTGKDEDGHVVTFTEDTNDCSWIKVDALTGVVSGTAPSPTSPPVDVTCTAVFKAKANGLFSAETQAISVTVKNHPPTAITCTSTSVSMPPGGAVKNLSCTGTDPDVGTSLVYSVTGCSGVSINSATGVLGGSLQSLTDCSLVVSASDGAAAVSTTLSFIPHKSFITVPQGLSGFTTLGSSRVRDIFYVSNTFYAATDGGLCISTDSGTTWVTKTTVDGLGSNNVRTVHGTGGNIYAGTDAGICVYSTTTGKCSTKTTDHGLPSTDIRMLFSVSGMVAAATAGGLSYSTNEGTAWTSRTNANSGLPSNSVNSVYIDGTVLYAGTDAGLGKSADNGASWTTTADVTGDATTDKIKSIYASGTTLQLGTESGLAVSANGGTTYSVKTASGNSLGSNIVNGTTKTSGGVVYAATTGGISSSANGTSFANVSMSWNSEAYSANNVIVIPGQIIAATDGGLGVSTDGSIYTPINTTGALDDQNIKRIFVDNSTLYVATAWGFGKSTNSGASFRLYKVVHGLVNNTINDIYASSSKIYAATSGGFSLSTDSGTTWTNKTTAHSIGSNTVNSIAVNGNKIYLATAAGVSISTDAGTAWTNVTAGLPSTNVKQVVLSGSVLYAATASGVAASTDGGTTWASKTGSLGAISANRIYASGLSIYVATNTGLAISTNGGQSWTLKTTTDGLPSATIYSITSRNGILFAGTAAGLAMSDNSGTTWTTKLIADGLGSNTINDVYGTDDYLYIGTQNGLARSK